MAGIDPSLGARFGGCCRGPLKGEARRPAVRRLDRARAVRRPRPDLAPAARPPPLAHLHPAQIADLVEAASHEEGEEILEAVGQDQELEADVFEELDDEHQLEFLDERTDREVAAVLSRMASDDAADLLLEIKQERRAPVLDLLPPAKQRKIKGLLGYNPSTAGGVMSPDFVTVARARHGGRGARRRARHDIAPETLHAILLTDADGMLAGSSRPAADPRRPADARCDLAEHSPPSVTPRPRSPRSRG